MSTEKKSAIRSVKPKSWSTRPARSEPSTGGERKSGRSEPMLVLLPAAPAHREEHRAEQGHGAHAGRAHGAHGDGAVLAVLGVVPITEQQELVGRGADLALRRLHQAEAEIARREVDPEEVP